MSVLEEALWSFVTVFLPVNDGTKRHWMKSHHLTLHHALVYNNDSRICSVSSVLLLCLPVSGIFYPLSDLWVLTKWLPWWWEPNRRHYQGWTILHLSSKLARVSETLQGVGKANHYHRLKSLVDKCYCNKVQKLKVCFTENDIHWMPQISGANVKACFGGQSLKLKSCRPIRRARKV